MPLTQQERILLLSALGSPELTRSIADIIDQSGVGDVVGPSSATTNDVVRFDGATGKLVKAGLAYASTNTVSTLVQRDSSGNFAAGTITAALTGTASGNTAYTPNQYGLVVSGAANTMTVIAPDASTTKVLTSGGVGASPSWQTLSTSGAVIGPASALDYGIPTYDSTTGKLLRDSGAILALTSVPENFRFGSTVIPAITSGTVNTVGGFYVGTALSSGTGNTLFGNRIGELFTNHSYTTIMGHYNFRLVTGGGGSSVGMGYFVGANLTTLDDSVMIGNSAGSDATPLTSAYKAVFIGGSSGKSVGASATDVIALGYGAKVTADNQFVTGSTASPLNAFYFGKGVTSASPASTTFNTTGGSGTDIAGADFILAAGKGTGSGTPGLLKLQTSTAAGSSTTLQTLTDRLTINGSGLVSISSGNLNMHTGGAALNGFSTGEINLVAGGTERVQVSAGSSNTTDVSGGEVQLVGGESTASGTGVGGAIVLLGGNATDGTGDGGYVGLYAGNSTGGTGGNIDISAGTGSSNGRIFMSTNTAERFSIDAAGKVTIGTAADTTTIHAINGATEAAAAATATMTNAPTNCAGNPDVWIKISYNGTTYVMPAWTP